MMSSGQVKFPIFFRAKSGANFVLTHKAWQDWQLQYDSYCRMEKILLDS
jgi:hypothetical protein